MEARGGGGKQTFSQVLEKTLSDSRKTFVGGVLQGYTIRGQDGREKGKKLMDPGQLQLLERSGTSEKDVQMAEDR